MPALLLDTCAMIFIAEGQPIDRDAEREIGAAIVSGGVLVSPVSAWEIGLLAAKKRTIFLPDAREWFRSFVAYRGVRLTPLTPEIAINASFLPSAAGGSQRPLAGDPADRLLIATARDLDVPIVTRDRVILGYAQAGFAKAIAC